MSMKLCPECKKPMEQQGSVYKEEGDYVCTNYLVCKYAKENATPQGRIDHEDLKDVLI